MDRGAWQATVHVVAKSRTQQSDFCFTSLFLTQTLIERCFYLIILENRHQKRSKFYTK